MLKLVIAEDSTLLADGLAQLLRGRGCEVTAIVGDVPSLMKQVEAGRPDVCVVDVRMPPTQTDEGIRAAIRIRSLPDPPGVLVFSQYVETSYAGQLLADGAGGIGYLLKDRVADLDEFVGALRRVAAGQTAFDPEVVDQLLNAATAQQRLEGLAPREREVLGLLAEGHSNAAIARRLVLSERSVEKNIARIFDKLALPRTPDSHRRVQAVLSFLRART